MKLNINGKTAILFARIWGVIAILFGLLILFIAIHDVFEFQITTEQMIIKLLMLVFAFGFVFLGRFFLKAKMSIPQTR